MAIVKIGIKSRDVEGILYDGTNIEEIKQFIATCDNASCWCLEENVQREDSSYILNVNHEFVPGNWVIKLISGNAYNFTPEMFEQDYYVIG